MAQPANLSPKQQRFVDGIIAGKSATAAYSTAYDCDDKTGAANGSRLLRNAKVAASIAARRAKVVEATGLTLQSHLDRLNELASQAADSEQYSAAVSAEVSRGKASGFYVERREHSGLNGGPIRVEIVREGKRRKSA